MIPACRHEGPDVRDRIADRLAVAFVVTAIEDRVRSRLASELAAALSAKAKRRRADFAAYYASIAPAERAWRRIQKSIWENQRRAMVANMRRGTLPATDRGFDFAFDRWMPAAAPYVDALAAAYQKWGFPTADKEARRQADLWTLPMKAVGDRVTKPDIVPGAEWSLFNRDIQTWLKTYSFRFSKKLATVDEALLRKELLAGWKAGENMAQLTKRVNATYANFYKYRSNMIAQTETIRASAQGAKRVYARSGVVDASMWCATPDEFLCGLCSNLDGKHVGLDDNYSGEWTVVAEGRKPRKISVTTDAPPAHPRCRCCLVPIFIGETVGPDGLIYGVLEPKPTPRPPIPPPPIPPPPPKPPQPAPAAPPKPFPGDPAPADCAPLPVSAGETVPSFIEDFAKRHHGVEWEYGAGYDANGVKLIEKKGRKHSVNYDWQEWRTLRTCSYNVHNHPSQTTFSAQDFKYSFELGKQKTYVVDVLGRIWVMEQTPLSLPPSAYMKQKLAREASQKYFEIASRNPLLYPKDSAAAKALWGKVWENHIVPFAKRNHWILKRIK